MIVTKGMYDKEFKFNNNGKEESIIIKPLSAPLMKKLFRVVKAINIKDVKELQILPTDSEDVKTSKQLKLSEVMTEIVLEDEILQYIIEIVTATIEKSYPNMDAEVKDDFISANMFNLMPFIFDVNLKRK